MLFDPEAGQLLVGERKAEPLQAALDRLDKGPWNHLYGDLVAVFPLGHPGRKMVPYGKAHKHHWSDYQAGATPDICDDDFSDRLPVWGTS